MRLLTALKKVCFLMLFVVFFNCTTNSSDSSNFPPALFTITPTEVNATTVDITWTDAIDPDGDLVIYTIIFEGNVMFPTIGENSYTINGLTPSVTYSGSISASDNHNNVKVVPFSFEKQ